MYMHIYIEKIAWQVLGRTKNQPKNTIVNSNLSFVGSWGWMDGMGFAEKRKIK